MNAKVTTLQTRVQAFQRGLLGTSMSLARLPLSAAERLTGQRGNDEWPPAVAFEGLEAQVETIAGSLLRDETLEGRGRLRQAKVAQLREALALEALADQERRRGKRSLRQRLQRAETRREQAEHAAEHRAEIVEDAAQRRKAGAKATAQKKAASAGRAKAQQDEAIDRVDRATRSKALREESAALAAERRALAAEERVASLDDAIDANKAARKSG